MSSQLTSPPVHQPEPPEKPKKVDLSASQVLGGALAAMTAAALGSRIGVAGTVIGAAVASVVAAVGGSIYTASIRASRERVRTVFVRRPTDRTDPAAPPVQDAEPVTTEPLDADLPSPTKRAWSWKTAGVGALAAFVLAGAAVTGFEVFTGNALSGGDGTTITQVGRDASGSDPRTDEPSTRPSTSASSEPSASSSDEPSATPSTDPSASAIPSESASADPSPSASASASTPSADGTPSATPSAGTDAG